jgi:hypothetical protein
MADTVWAIEVQTRSISDAVRGKPFKTTWRYYRFRWFARFVVWCVNTFGAGRDYDRARLLGETL